MENETKMPILGVSAKVKAPDRYKKFLQVLSLFLPSQLSPTEMRIIEEFYWHADGQITRDSRKTVREILEISAHQLNNYIKVLRERKLINDDRLHKVFMITIPESTQLFIQVALTVEA